MKLLRASPGARVFADSAGRYVPMYRHVYSEDKAKREDAYRKLLSTYQHLERHGIGITRANPQGMAHIHQTPVDKHVPKAQSTLRAWGVPLHFFEGFLECVSQTASVQDERRIVQQARLSPQAPSKTDSPEHDSGPMPTLPWSLAKAAKGRPPSQLSSKTDDSGNPDYENIYNGLAERGGGGGGGWGGAGGGSRQHKEKQGSYKRKPDSHKKKPDEQKRGNRQHKEKPVA